MFQVSVRAAGTGKHLLTGLERVLWSLNGRRRVPKEQASIQDQHLDIEFGPFVSRYSRNGADKSGDSAYQEFRRLPCSSGYLSGFGELLVGIGRNARLRVPSFVVELCCI